VTTDHGKTFALAGVLLLAALLCLGRPGAVSAGALDDVTDTLKLDDGSILYAFNYPDAFGDNYRNLRFQSPANGTLTGVMMAFATRDFNRYTSGDPALVVMVWPSGADSFPVLGQELLRDTIPFADYSGSVFSLDSGLAGWHNRPAQFVAVDLSAYGVHLQSGQWFHVGYTAILNSPDDTLSILSDDGSPSTNRGSEYYNGHFYPMSRSWPGVNFMIRPILRVPTGVGLLEPDGTVKSFELHAAYPNPFNSSTTIAFDLARAGQVRLSVVDMLGREVGVPLGGILTAGSHVIPLSGATWASGVYFVRLETQQKAQTIKIVLEK
jgi:hypothetical protein